MGTVEAYLAESAHRFAAEPDRCERQIGNSSTEVYRTESTHGPIVLKLYPYPKAEDLMNSYEAIRERLDFESVLADASEETFGFAKPLQSTAGQLIEIVEVESRKLMVTAYDRVPGRDIRHREDGIQFDLEDAQIGGRIYELIGRAMGRMHRLASEYPIWWSRADAGIEDNPFYGTRDLSGAGVQPSPYSWMRWVDSNIGLSPELSPHWEELRTRMSQLSVGRGKFGYVHGDFSLTNIMYDGVRLTPIDFDGFYGHFALDIGTPLSGLRRFDGSAELFPYIWDRFLTGYESEWQVKYEWLPWITLFLDAVRLVTYLLNVLRIRARQTSYDFPGIERK